MTTPKLVHQHLIVSATILRLPQDILGLKEWYVQLVKKIKMKLVSPEDLLNGSENPLVYDCKVFGNKGFTISGVIETSHIVIHTWDFGDHHTLQLDVYSCAEIKPEVIFEHLSVFEPTEIFFKFLDRENGLREVAVRQYTLEVNQELVS